MRTELETGSRLHDVTFTWTETEPARPAHDVLVRLISHTDHAYDDGDLGPFLLHAGPGGEWSRTLRLPRDLRTSYQLCPVRDEPLRDRHPDDDRWAEIMAMGAADPRNPALLGEGCTYGNPGPASVLELPEAPPQPWYARVAGAPRGELTRHELGAGADGASVIRVYTPPGYRSAWAALPLVIMFDGSRWANLDIAATFDNLIADGSVEPMIVVLVESMHGAARRHSLTRPALFMPFLLQQLLPFMADRWKVSDDPARTLLAGQSLGGLAAMHAALTAPERFGMVIGQSSALWWPGDPEGGLSGGRLIDACATTPRKPVRFFLEAGSAERELLDQNRRMRDVLHNQGYHLTYREYEGGHDFACWRGGLADGLVTLLGSA